MSVMEQPNLLMGVLPDTDRVIEVVGFGRVRRQPGGALECQIQVHLAPLRDDGRFDEGSQVLSRWIGVGKLPILRIGSRWRRRMPERSPLRQVHSAKVVCVGMETIGGVLEGSDHDRHPLAFEPEARCFRLQLDGDPDRVAIVPVVEVIRSVFGCSSGFLRQLFDGVRDPTIARRRFLFDRERSVAHGRRVNVICNSKPTTREAWTAAMIMTSAPFRASHDGVFARMQVAGWPTGTATQVETTFPFPDHAPIRFAYERLLVRPGTGARNGMPVDGSAAPPTWTRRQVELITCVRVFDDRTRLDQVTYDWPQIRIVGDAPRAARQKRGPGKRGRPTLLDDSTTPGTFRARRSVVVEAAAVLSFKRIKFTPCPRLVGCKLPTRALARTGWHGHDEGTTIKGSTAEAHWQGDVGTTQIEIRANQAAGDRGSSLGGHDASMIQTELAIRLLAANRGWSVRGLADAPGSMPPVLPFLSRGSPLPVAEFEVLTERGPVMIYEAGWTGGKRHALGIVARCWMAPFSDLDRRGLREMVSRAGGHWQGRNFDGHVHVSLRRLVGLWTDTPAYAEFIGARIDALVAATI